jgi:hypothetical protein
MLAKTSNTVFNWRGKSKHSYLVPIISRINSLFTAKYIDCGFSKDASNIKIREVHVFSYFVESSYHEWILNFVKYSSIDMFTLIIFHFDNSNMYMFYAEDQTHGLTHAR